MRRRFEIGYSIAELLWSSVLPHIGGRCGGVRDQREIDRALAELSLTHLQFTPLTLAAWLGRSRDEAAQAHLMRVGDLHPMQVTLTLKPLKEFMATRPPSQSDVRAKPGRQAE